MFNLDLDIAIADLILDIAHLGMEETRAAALAPVVASRLRETVELHKKEFHRWSAGQWFIDFDQHAAALQVAVRCEGGVTRSAYSL